MAPVRAARTAARVAATARAYTELFGQGIVVYWFGFIEGVHPPKNVLIMDETFFEKDLKGR